MEADKQEAKYKELMENTETQVADSSLYVDAISLSAKQKNSREIGLHICQTTVWT